MSVMERTHDTPETSKKPGAISLKNVLFATDFSPTSDSALPYATAFCRRFGSTLHVAHVLSDANLALMTGGVDYVSVNTIYDDAVNQAQEKIRQITARLGQIPCQTYVRHGQVWTNLSSIVAANAIDLIVVGTRGRSGLGTLLLGSVAEDILRHAPCPVLTVGPGVCGRFSLPAFHDDSGGLAPVELELHQILYATNLTPASLRVAPVAIRLAEEFKSRLTLLHVIEEWSEYAKLEARPGPIENGVQQLQTVIPKDAALVHAPEWVVEFGAVPENILYAAAQRESDLIVLGARPANHATRRPWSTVHRVVAQATCPVLTVGAE